MSAPDGDILKKFEAALASETIGKLGVAVSGGGDSMACLRLAVDWAAGAGVPLCAVTVDHGLRPESGGEAAFVADTCTKLGVPHETLHWARPDEAGNLQDQARRARYALIGEWATKNGVTHVLVAHTADDEAETFLMRLGREAGLDGLSGMRARWTDGGVTWLRPLLAARREALRDYLNERGQAWVEDPSNVDPRYERVRMREALAHLERAGIMAENLNAVAENLRAARDALDTVLADWARKHVRQEAGDLILDARAFADLPEDLARRLLNAGLRWVSSSDYVPRAAKVLRQVEADAPGRATLHGCLVTRTAQAIRIAREPAAVADEIAHPGALWDRRWRITGQFQPEDEIRMTGEQGLAACPEWRETGLPRLTLIAGPAVWRGETLVSAPLARPDPAWTARLAEGRDDFTTFLQSH